MTTTEILATTAILVAISLPSTIKSCTITGPIIKAHSDRESQIKDHLDKIHP